MDGELRIARIANRKIRAIGMMENESADAGFRVHHHAFGKVYANFLGM
jgi:hypothetical protein